MSTEATTPDGEATEQQIKSKDVPATLDEALELINHLKSIKNEAFKERDDFKKRLKKFEDEHLSKEQELLKEQGKYKELYEAALQQQEQLQGALKNKAIDSALKELVVKAGARSVETVSKLIDRAQISIGDDFTVDTGSIQAQLEALKKSDPILFGIDNSNLPPVRRPTDGSPQGGYEQEIKTAKSQKEILEVMKKYGKI